MSQKPQVYYSGKYYDDIYEYRHVIVPKEVAKQIPKDSLMSEKKCRDIGVIQSDGWNHYMIHKPEPHVLLFRRKLKGPAPTQEEQVKEDMFDE